MSGAGAGAPTPPAGTDGDLVAAAVADALSCADQVATNMGKVLGGGTYTSADAAADAVACAATAASWAGRLASSAWMLPFSLFAPPPLVPQPSSRVPGQVTIADRPLTLHTVGFRAIGYGPEYFIQGNRITFEPPTIGPDSSPDFVMVVDWHSLPNAARVRTIVYEGEVTSAQQAATQVTAAIRFVKPAFAS